MSDSEVVKVESWLKTHERLVLAIIAGLVLWFAIGKIDKLIQNHDNANLQQAKVVAQVQQEKNEALAAQVAQQAADMSKLQAQAQAQTAALEQERTVLLAALAQRQKTDASLPPSELVNRWYTLVPQAKPTVMPNGVALDNAGAVATVQQLELVPVQQKELVEIQQEKLSLQGLLTASAGQVATLNTLVAGKDVLLADNAKVCDARVKVVQAEARRSKRRWFVVGYVAGFLSRQAIKTYLGI